MASKPVDLEEMYEGSIPLKPEYSPFNEAAFRILDTLYLHLESTPKSSKTTKRGKAYALFLSSFLAVSQRLSFIDKGVIAIPEDSHYWRQFDGVGWQIKENIVQDLIKASFITRVPLSGKRYIWQDDHGLWQSQGVLTQFHLNDSLLNLADFVEATWISTGRTEILISKAETIPQKKRREQEGRKRKKLTSKEVQRVLNKRDYKTYTKLANGVRKLNRFWRDHPLILPPDGNGYSIHCASATRVFHNGSIKSGGRYYGEWTNLDGWIRRRATIDGEATVQIDLNASQPTLFSSLMGYEMNVGGRWEDLYDIVVEPLDGENKRAKAKQVAMELIGTGNSRKKAPASDCKIDFNREELAVDEEGNTLDEYGIYRHRLLEVVPALAELNSEYLNGAGYLSYHEAEIMRLSLEKLVSIGVPAYPVHDCLITKISNQDVVLQTYRNTLSKYVLKESSKRGHTPINLVAPVSIEADGTKERIEGYYIE